MIDPIPFRPDRFRSAAMHYLGGRPAYSPRLIAKVAEFCGFGSASHLLDLGCGPGPLTLAFAPLVGSVLAVDPEPEMLDAARELTRSLRNVEFRQGTSADLGPDFAPDFGPLSATLMGRSFHWMDRVETLRRLDALTQPGGAVICFDTAEPDLPENAWHKEFEALLDRYRDEPLPQRQPGWVRHEAVLLDSAFSTLDVIATVDRRTIDGAAMLNRALSFSCLTPARLGDRLPALRRDVEAMAVTVAVDGGITEVITSRALIATRA